MNRKFICKSNYVLRKILNTKDNIDILKDFIEAFLKIEISEIELNPYLNEISKQLPAEENFGIADLRITKVDGEEINIGIQCMDGFFIEQKLLLYYAQLHANQLKHKNRNFAKTITINILNFNQFEYLQYHSRMVLRNVDDDIEFPEKLEIHVIELEKFIPDSFNNVLNKEQEWMMYLKKDNIDKRIENKKIKKLEKLVNEYWNAEVME